MQNQYLSLNNSKRLVLIASLSILLALTGLLGGGALADTNFDTSGIDYQGQANASAGTGIGQANGQTGPNIGNTNVSFSDFGFTQNPPDLLPIKQQYTTTTGLPINSYQATNIYQTGVKSGTSPTQAPQLNGQSTLAPSTTALQSTFSPTAYTPLPSGQYSFGFKPQAYGAYTGPYAGSGPNQTGFIPSVLGVNNILPPTSMGSMDFNIRSK
jgi:hypothetical protein